MIFLYRFNKMELSIDQKRIILEDIFTYRESKNELMLKYHPDKNLHSNAEFCFLQQTLSDLKRDDLHWKSNVKSSDELKRKANFHEPYMNNTTTTSNKKQRVESGLFTFVKCTDSFLYSKIGELTNAFFAGYNQEKKKKKVIKKEYVHSNQSCLLVSDILIHLNTLLDRYYPTTFFSKKSILAHCAIGMTVLELELYCKLWVQDICTNALSKILQLPAKNLHKPNKKKQALIGYSHVPKDTNWELIFSQKMQIVNKPTPGNVLLFTTAEEWIRWLFVERSNLF